ncbi:MAG: YfiR family protein [Archangiaceae bacterium]|nr:YfiR family protein [Archangiaceae bacterium]
MKALRTALCLSLVAAVAVAAEDRQVAILVRAFSYVYGLKQQAGETVTLAVVYKSGSSSSESNADGWLAGFKGVDKVSGLPFNTVKHAYESSEKLKALAIDRDVDIILVCEGLESELSGIKDVSRGEKILTVGAKEALVTRGLTLGVFAEGDKHTIVVNLAASQAEGITFSSDLLRLARVIR